MADDPSSQLDDSNLPLDDSNFPSNYFNLQLDDLVYEYPDINVPNFQTLISAKEEFRELGSDVTEPIPKRGEFFKHQLLIHRYMLIYDSLLLIHRAGTGKTGALGGTSEMFKRAMLHAAGNFVNLYIRPERTHIKRTIILVTGNFLKEQFKREIFCKFSRPEDYETPDVMKSSDISSMKRAITRELNKYYRIETYGKFAKSISSVSMDDDEIKRTFSGTLFILDEVHNLRIDPTKETDKTKLRLKYNIIHKVLHLVDRSKIMLATATPMINDPSEIVPIMNLILPLDKQMPKPIRHESRLEVFNLNEVDLSNTYQKNYYNYSNPKLEDLEPYFRGRISFVRELDTMATVKYVGIRLEANYIIGGNEYDSFQIIYPTLMSSSNDNGDVLRGPDGNPFPGQEEIYLESAEMMAKTDVAHLAEQQAANFVFPDGTYGKVGFKKYVSKENKQYVANKELLQWISDPYYLRLLSAKFGRVIEITERPENDMKSVFCYIPFVKGSGAIVLSLCFKAMGYELFDQSESIFETTADKSVFESYCPPIKDENVNTPMRPDRKAKIPKRKRVALFTGSESTERNANILETFNSPENRHGEYIKVIIVSPIGREGINTANVQLIHLVGANWNQSITYQTTSRVLRSTSHVDLLKEERLKLMAQGQNPDNARVCVDIYQHAAVTSRDISIDVNMYEYSERKDIEIKRLERIAKQSTIDCQIHYRRNIQAHQNNDIGSCQSNIDPNSQIKKYSFENIDGSPSCDYDVCDYQCADPPPSEIDYESYDVLYSGPTIEAAIVDIKNIFKREFSMPLSNLYLTLSTYRAKFIDLAIEQIITNKLRLIDRFGYSSYMREDNGVIFLQHEFPLVDQVNSQDNHSLSTYASNLIAIDSLPFSKYEPDIGISRQSDLIDEIYRLIPVTPYDPRVRDLLDQLDNDTLITLVEALILDHASKRGNTSSLLKEVMRIYGQYIFNLAEPRRTISTVAKKLVGPRGGGRRVAETETTIVDVEFTDTPETYGDLIYFHTLNSRKIHGGEYTKLIDLFEVRGQIRLLKVTEGLQWRDATPPEQLVYTKYAHDVLSAKREQFESQGIYGIMLHTDDVVRVVDMESYRRRLTGAKSKKDKPRGQKCTDYKRPQLIDIFYRLGIDFLPGQEPRVLPEWDRETYIRLIRDKARSGVPDLETMSLDQLIYTYKWYATGRTVVDMCMVLEDELRRRGLLWEI